GMIVTASDETPASSSVSIATASIRFVRLPLKRETTTATERRCPLGVPSSTAYPSGTSISPATCCTLSPSSGTSSITSALSGCGHEAKGSSEGSSGSAEGSSSSGGEAASDSGEGPGGSATSVACSPGGATGAMGVVAPASACARSSCVSLIR